MAELARKGRLSDKICIVTGAGTGIGEAISHKFAYEGAKLLLVGLPDDPVDDVAAHLRRYNHPVTVFKGDVGDPKQAEAAVKLAVDTFGRLDVLINNAGAFPETAETQEFSLESFDQMVHDNIRTAFLMTRYALPHLQKTRGVVLSAGSEAGQLGLPQNTAYGGTKGWMHAFMKGVAVEQAKHGVRACCVCPGPVDTAWTRKEAGPMDEEMEEMVVQATPLGRRGSPEEIANVYAFLASDEASYCTGALFFVDGGITVAKGNVGQKVPDDLRRQPEGMFSLPHQHEGRTS